MISLTNGTCFYCELSAYFLLSSIWGTFWGVFSLSFVFFLKFFCLLSCSSILLCYACSCDGCVYCFDHKRESQSKGVTDLWSIIHDPLKNNDQTNWLIWPISLYTRSSLFFLFPLYLLSLFFIWKNFFSLYFIVLKCAPTFFSYFHIFFR